MMTLTGNLWALFDGVRHDPPITREEFGAALAAEERAQRRATIERIRARVRAIDYRGNPPYDDVLVILDEEANR